MYCNGHNMYGYLVFRFDSCSILLSHCLHSVIWMWYLCFVWHTHTHKYTEHSLNERRNSQIWICALDTFYLPIIHSCQISETSMHLRLRDYNNCQNKKCLMSNLNPVGYHYSCLICDSKLSFYYKK